MKSWTTIKAAGLAAAMVFAASANTSIARELTYNSFLPPGEPVNSVGMIPFWERMEADTNGEITGKMFYAGQMIGMLETLAGIGDGAVDSGFVIASSTPRVIPSVAIFNDVQILSRNPAAALGAATETQLLDCPRCLEELSKANVVALGGNSAAPYYLMCNKDLETVEDFEGLRLMSPSRINTEIANTFGMTPVNVTFTEMVPGLQRGTIDCVLGFDSWFKTFNLAEIIKAEVVTRHFGAYSSPTTMTINKEVWEELSPETQQAFIKNTAQMVAEATLALVADSPPARAYAVEKGVKEVDMGEGFLVKYNELVSKERDNIVANYEMLGVAEAGEIVDKYLANYAKWEKLVGDDIDSERLTKLLMDEVYSKAKF